RGCGGWPGRSWSSCTSGTCTPASNPERLDLAEWCQLQKLYHTATRLYADTFAADPKLADDLKAQHRPFGIAATPAGDLYTVGRLRMTTDFDPGPGVYTLTPVDYNPDPNASGPTDAFVWKLTQSSPLLAAAVAPAAGPSAPLLTDAALQP